VCVWPLAPLLTHAYKVIPKDTFSGYSRLINVTLPSTITEIHEGSCTTFSYEAAMSLYGEEHGGEREEERAARGEEHGEGGQRREGQGIPGRACVL